MENKSGFRPNPQLKLMDQVKEVLRYYHYAYRTEETIASGYCATFIFTAARPIPVNWGVNMWNVSFRILLFKGM